jgi:hypothetical protein
VIPTRFYIYAGVALLIGYLVWREHSLTRKLATVRVELSQANANLKAEQEDRRKANESAQRYAARIGQSRRPRSPPPKLLCRLPASVPKAAASGGTDAATAPDNLGEHEEVDIGPRIDVPFRACEENLIKLEELQRFLR